MKKLHLVALVVLTFFATTAHADYNDFNSNDTFRAFNEVTVAWDAVATTASLDSGGTGDVIVSDYDIYTGSPTAVPSGSVNSIKGARTLALKMEEASGSSVTGTITIVGRNQFGQYAGESILFTGGTGYAVTRNAYTGKPTINLDLNNVAASDVLRVGVYAFGVQAKTTTAPTVVIGTDGGSTSSSIDAGTWNATWSTYLPASLTAGNLIQFIGFSESMLRPSPSVGTVTASASAFGT